MALTVRGADHLLDVVRALLPGEGADASGLREPRPLPRRTLPRVHDPIDVRGQSAAKRALEVAAAGQFSMLMVGPPGTGTGTGTGKSMLARPVVGLLPPLSHAEALGRRRS